jgi:hypothetical protein
MHHPFTELVLKLVNDPTARNAYLNNGTIPAGCVAPTSAQADILRPPGHPLDAKAHLINSEIDKEWAAAGSPRATTVVAAATVATATTEVTEVAAASVSTAVPQVKPGPHPNWPSRP